MLLPLRGSSLHGNILYVGNRSSLRDRVYLGSEFFAFAETFVVLFLCGVELVVVLFDLLVDVLVNLFVFSLSAFCVFDVLFIVCHLAPSYQLRYSFDQTDYLLLECYLDEIE